MSHRLIDPLFVSISFEVAAQTLNAATHMSVSHLEHPSAAILQSLAIAKGAKNAQIGTSMNVQTMPTRESARRKNAPFHMLTVQDNLGRLLPASRRRHLPTARKRRMYPAKKKSMMKSTRMTSTLMSLIPTLMSPWWNLSRVVLAIKNFRGSRTLSISDSDKSIYLAFRKTNSDCTVIRTREA